MKYFFNTVPIAVQDITIPVIDDVVSPPTRSTEYSSQAILYHHKIHQ